MESSGPWTVAFTPGWGAPDQVRMDRLESWTKASEEGVRHYSGTAAYTNEFELPDKLSAGARVVLDLGEVRRRHGSW